MQAKIIYKQGVLEVIKITDYGFFPKYSWQNTSSKAVRGPFNDLELCLNDMMMHNQTPVPPILEVISIKNLIPIDFNRKKRV